MTEDAAFAAALGSGPFQKFLGFQYVEHDTTAGSVAVRLPWRPDFERGLGSQQWHGGVIAALIDTAGAFALIARLGRGVPTIDLRIDYLRPAVDTDLLARARTLRAGRSIGVVDIDVTDDAGRLVAVGRGTFSTLT